jgi:hypothetical protein
MENYPITISVDKKVHHFEVGEYLHEQEGKCKYRVYENGAYVASFTGHLWLLSRENSMPEDMKRRFLDKAAGLGFEISKLEWMDDEG